MLFIELSELNLIFARTGKFDLEITTFQMAVLFCWENRREDKLSLENLRLATELPDAELRKTLWSLVAFPKLKRQVLLYDPSNTKPTEWNENTVFWINQVQLTLFSRHSFCSELEQPVRERVKVGQLRPPPYRNTNIHKMEQNF